MAKYSQGEYQIINTNKYVGKKAPFARSSWETRVMYEFDTNPAVIAWASEEISIPYINPFKGPNVRSLYIPDFLVQYIDANNQIRTELVEVKPFKESLMAEAKSTRDKYTVAVNMAKWQAANAFCKAQGMTFRILTEKDIFRGTKK